jgi:hypothetical protein
MLNFEKASKIIEEHFSSLTDEEFVSNLREYCPKLFNQRRDLNEVFCGAQKLSLAEKQQLIQLLTIELRDKASHSSADS